MQQIALVALGGSIGAVARYALSMAVARNVDVTFPWGTIIVNLSGSFFIGVLAELFDATLIPGQWKSFASIGVIGGYTTFSTLMLESVNLLRDGEWRLVGLNIVVSNVLGILFVLLGVAVCRLTLKR